MAFSLFQRTMTCASLDPPLSSFTVDHITRFRVILICHSLTGLRGLLLQGMPSYASAIAVAAPTAKHTLLVFEGLLGLLIVRI